MRFNAANTLWRTRGHYLYVSIFARRQDAENLQAGKFLPLEVLKGG
jgi:hypothetical protein